MADMTQMTGAYAASWLPWILIPMITYILPFPVFAIVFLWIEREGVRSQPVGSDSKGQPLDASMPMGAEVMGERSA